VAYDNSFCDLGRQADSSKKYGKTLKFYLIRYIIYDYQKRPVLITIAFLPIPAKKPIAISGETGRIFLRICPSPRKGRQKIHVYFKGNRVNVSLKISSMSVFAHSLKKYNRMFSV